MSFVVIVSAWSEGEAYLLIDLEMDQSALPLQHATQPATYLRPWQPWLPTFQLGRTSDSQPPAAECVVFQAHVHSTVSNTLAGQIDYHGYRNPLPNAALSNLLLPIQLLRSESLVVKTVTRNYDTPKRVIAEIPMTTCHKTLTQNLPNHLESISQCICQFSPTRMTSIPDSITTDRSGQSNLDFNKWRVPLGVRSHDITEEYSLNPSKSEKCTSAALHTQCLLHIRDESYAMQELQLKKYLEISQNENICST